MSTYIKIERHPVKIPLWNEMLYKTSDSDKDSIHLAYYSP
jgi:hypothetical protein